MHSIGSRFRKTLITFAVLAMAFTFRSSVARADSASLETKYEPYLVWDNGGEVAQQRTRQKLMALTKPEVSEFILVAKKWLHGSDIWHQRAMLTFDVLRHHAGFDKEIASEMLKTIKESKTTTTSGHRSQPPNSFDLVLEKRLEIFLAAKVGGLTPERIASEFKFIGDNRQDSVVRLARASALIDAMGADQSRAEIKPTTAQLELLLESDVSDIRRLAVDWFQLSPPSNPAERTRFLVAALNSKPRQVRETAQRACQGDPSPVVREKCLKSKSDGEPQ